jgi:GNAT superfamily N-acetyltransferase
MQMLQSGYAIRSAQVEELPLLAPIEQAAAIRFQDTPYAFLADSEPLSIEFVQQRFQAGQVWVIVDQADQVIGFALTREVDRTLYLEELDIAPQHGRRGLGKALVETVQAWGKDSGYNTMSLSTFRDLPWNAPFYAKLGFRILDAAELTVGFQAIRQHEHEAGHPIDDRVIMHCALSPLYDRYTKTSPSAIPLGILDAQRGY